MKRTFAIISALLILGTIQVSEAGVLSRDWKTPGDGLLTYDDVNQREWLDVPVSLMTQFSGATLEARFQDAILELQPGGRFEGFTLANQSDVLALAQSAGVDTFSEDFNTNHVAVGALLDLFGRTVVVAPGSSTSGLVSDTVPPPPTKCPCHLVAVIHTGVQDTYPAGLTFISTPQIGLDDGGIRTTGMFLYRQVPEPSSILLAVFGVLLIKCFRIKQRGVGGI